MKKKHLQKRHERKKERRHQHEWFFLISKLWLIGSMWDLEPDSHYAPGGVITAISKMY